MARKAAGALAVDPNLSSRAQRQARTQAMAQAHNNAPGAMGVDPSGRKGGFQVGGDLGTLDAQEARLQAIINKKGAGNAPEAAKRLQLIAAQRAKLGGAAPAPAAGTGEAPADFNSVTGQSNEALSNTFEQIQNQGPFDPGQFSMQNYQQFNPGDYSAMRQRAEDSVMNSFNNRMNPQFEQQGKQFQQQMADQGIPEGSELYNRQYQQLQQSQNDARQHAMGQAFQLGQSEQAQGFGQNLQGFGANMEQQGQGWNQSFQGYQLPLAQLNAMSPYYNVQGQMGMQNSSQQFQGAQNEADRKMQMQLAKYGRGTAWGAPRGGGGGGGGGGMSMQDRFALQDREFYNNLVGSALANGNQGGGGPNYGTAFAGGLAGGAALGAGLKS